MAIAGFITTETVTVTPRAGSSAYGSTFGVQYEAEGYFEPQTRKVTNARGEDVVANLFGILAPDCPIRAGDKITRNGQHYEAIDVQPLALAGVAHHIEARFRSVA